MTQPLNPTTYPTFPAGTPAAYLLWNNGASWLFFDCVLSEDWNEGTQVTEHPVEQSSSSTTNPGGANVADNVRVEVPKVQLSVVASNEPIDTNNWAVPNEQALPLTLPQPSWVPDSGIRTVQEWNNMQNERVAARDIGGAVGGIVGGTVGGIIGEAAGSVVGGLLFAPHEEDTVVFSDAGNTPPAAPPGLVVPTTLQFTEVDDFVARTIAQIKTLKDSATLIQVVGSKDSAQNMVIETFTHHRDKDTGSAAEITIGLKQIRFASTSQVVAPAPTVPQAKPPVSKGNQNSTDAPPKKDSVWRAQRRSLQGQ